VGTSCGPRINYISTVAAQANQKIQSAPTKPTANNNNIYSQQFAFKSNKRGETKVPTRTHTITWILSWALQGLHNPWPVEHFELSRRLG